MVNMWGFHFSLKFLRAPFFGSERGPLRADGGKSREKADHFYADVAEWQTRRT